MTVIPLSEKDYKPRKICPNTISKTFWVPGPTGDHIEYKCTYKLYKIGRKLK
jgi:hypothetical protein